MAIYYFDLERAITTNGVTQTLSTHFRLLTAANQRLARVMAVSVKGRHGTAGGGAARLLTAAVAGIGGTAQTPAERDSTGPAAGTTAFNDATAITPGTTPVVRRSIGFAQTGGEGAWVAFEPQSAIHLEPNAGAPGNAEVGTLAFGTSLPADLGVEVAEG